jgi:hypothetical protein
MDATLDAVFAAAADAIRNCLYKPDSKKSTCELFVKFCRTPEPSNGLPYLILITRSSADADAAVPMIVHHCEIAQLGFLNDENLIAAFLTDELPLTYLQYPLELHWRPHTISVASVYAYSIPDPAIESQREQEERIVCAALRNAQGAVICGIRHYDSIMNAAIGREGPEYWIPREVEQGFVSNRYPFNFLTRKEAFVIAQRAGQIRPGKVPGMEAIGELDSSMLY